MNMQLEPELPSMIPEGVYRKLCYVLHRSLVEARNLAWKGESEQIAQLTDAFELLPSLLVRWEPDAYDAARQGIASYQRKYPHAFDYMTALDMDDHEFAATLARW